VVKKEANMNCAESQEKIALFTGADLPADEAVAVEAHLSVCADCRAFEQELSEARVMLLSMRSVEESDVAAVRSRVLGELQTRKVRSIFAWMPYAAAAGVAALMFGLAIEWRTPPTEPRASAIGVVVTPTEPRASASVRVATKRVAKRKPRIKPEAQRPAEPTVVTLFTDDPDVVIVWIAD
jgi:predicted anti-sigma-YlaC factor YlaD